MTNRKITSIFAARLLVTPIMVVGVLAYGPGLSSADGTRESRQTSTAPGSKVPLHAQGPGPSPKAWTGEALDPTNTRAILTGEVNAKDQRTRFRFQYGLTLPYAHTSEVGEREVVGLVPGRDRTSGPSRGSLDPGLDSKTKKTASRAAVSLYIWSTATGIRTPVSGLRTSRSGCGCLPDFALRAESIAATCGCSPACCCLCVAGNRVAP